MSDARLEARTAQAAAAEDFDPLRIRPYVELGGGDTLNGPHHDRGHDRRHDRGHGSTIQQGPEDVPTLVIPAVTAAPGPNTTEPDATRPGTEPSAPSAGRRRRRPGVILALVGAAAGVMAVAGFAGGLFSYDTPERNSALPDDPRASAPDTSADGDAVPVEESGNDGTVGGTSSDTPGSNPAGKPSPSPTPTSSPSPTPSSPASPSPTATEAEGADPSESGSASGTDAGAADRQFGTAVVLRPGDDGPEVTELQLRLLQLGFYDDDIDENYDRQVEQAVRDYQESRGITEDMDEPGVYGLVTRSRLESETKEP